MTGKQHFGRFFVKAIIGTVPFYDQLKYLGCKHPDLAECFKRQIPPDHCACESFCTPHNMSTLSMWVGASHMLDSQIIDCSCGQPAWMCTVYYTLYVLWMVQLSTVQTRQGGAAKGILNMEDTESCVTHLRSEHRLHKRTHTHTKSGRSLEVNLYWLSKNRSRQPTRENHICLSYLRQYCCYICVKNTD